MLIWRVSSEIIKFELVRVQNEINIETQTNKFDVILCVWTGMENYSRVICLGNGQWYQQIQSSINY